MSSKEHFDVIIVGAGLSGIGCAHHLVQQCPDVKFAILDAKDKFGGTWDTHRYPGVRCDSDFSVYGYSFKPWLGKPIATGEEILTYLKEVIDQNKLAPRMRFKHRIQSAKWSSENHHWTLEIVRGDSGEKVQFTANFLWMCQGYFRQEEGYTPKWEGMESFKGQIVHPQTWPQDLVYKNKRVVVIGSGATAATLIPSMAADCEHITMLQRSPTFFATKRNANDLAIMLRDLKIDASWIHEIVRRKIFHDNAIFVKRTVTEPEIVKRDLIENVRKNLSADIDVAKHFTPRYRPYQQRIAFVPDADLFQSINSGKASVETDEIERFVPEGILLKSGKILNADIVVTATGFNMNVMGDIRFVVDDQEIHFPDTVSYRGMMVNEVPNMVFVLGYFRLSWTPRVHLVADFVCRLLNHMKGIKARSVKVSLSAEDQKMKLGPFIDPSDLNSGYLGRAMDSYPKAGDKPEWRHSQDFMSDQKELPAISLDGAPFVYNQAIHRKSAA